jgi:UDP-glucose 4-epimerase
MRTLVTGGAGFIGSHLCDRLLACGEEVWCVDNLLLGRRRNIAHLEGLKRFHFVELDVRDSKHLSELFSDAGFQAVFHLAANSDIASCNANTRLDLELNQLTTLSVLEAMQAHGVRRLFFAGTSAIFGEADAVLHEDYAPLQPISFYGASKLAAEAYISVFAHTLGCHAVVLRFPNVVGEHATHGVIYDFLQKLKSDQSVLKVLGDGRQSKPYLYVKDLIEGIMIAWDKTPADLPFAVYHAGGIGVTSVFEIAHIVVAAAGRPDTRIEFQGGDRGWPGDVPRFSYDSSKLQKLGWHPKLESTDAVRQAVKQILSEGFQPD